MFNGHLKRWIIELETEIRDRNGVINHQLNEIDGLKESLARMIEKDSLHLGTIRELKKEIGALKQERERFVAFFDRIITWRKNQSFCFGELYDMIEAVDENAFKEEL